MLCLQGDSVDAINPSVELTETERVDRLRLIRSDNVGPRGIMAQTPQGAIRHHPLAVPHAEIGRPSAQMVGVAEIPEGAG